MGKNMQASIFEKSNLRVSCELFCLLRCTRQLRPGLSQEHDQRHARVSKAMMKPGAPFTLTAGI